MHQREFTAEAQRAQSPEKKYLENSYLCVLRVSAVHLPKVLRGSTAKKEFGEFTTEAESAQSPEKKYLKNFISVPSVPLWSIFRETARDIRALVINPRVKL